MGWVLCLWCGWVSSQPEEVDLTHTASAASPCFASPEHPACSLGLPVPVRRGLGKACSELT